MQSDICLSRKITFLTCNLCAFVYKELTGILGEQKQSSELPAECHIRLMFDDCLPIAFQLMSVVNIINCVYTFANTRTYGSKLR